jgi:hypothetical protein
MHAFLMKDQSSSTMNKDREFVFLLIFCSRRWSDYYRRRNVSYASVIATKFVVVRKSKNTYASANIAASVFADKVIFMLQHRLLYQAKFVKLIFHNILRSLFRFTVALRPNAGHGLLILEIF